ncbi:MAG: hypothetical protein KUG65_13155, partial [Sphingomonadaceae bacterium]|nr:hypothetical protein [Sphingomonadaceae bacterium]
RRAGCHFGPEPVEITPGQLGDDVEGARRLLAILSDPRLSCQLVVEGTNVPFPDDWADGLRETIAAAETPS